MATEIPYYTILTQMDGCELRRYDAQIVAQTWASGARDVAGRQGFKILAGYIFGKNSTQSGDSGKIAMTAPVMMQQTADKWRIQFVMPSHYTLQDLPQPNDINISISTLPIQMFAVIQFSGMAGADAVAKKTTELQTWIAHQNLMVIGVPELARYNPPWTLPFMRRNEIMIACQVSSKC